MVPQKSYLAALRAKKTAKKAKIAKNRYPITPRVLGVGKL